MVSFLAPRKELPFFLKKNFRVSFRFSCSSRFPPEVLECCKVPEVKIFDENETRFCLFRSLVFTFVSEFILEE